MSGRAPCLDLEREAAAMLSRERSVMEDRP
jgi:hypothetical protein